MDGIFMKETRMLPCLPSPPSLFFSPLIANNTFFQQARWWGLSRWGPDPEAKLSTSLWYHHPQSNMRGTLWNIEDHPTNHYLLSSLWFSQILTAALRFITITTSQQETSHHWSVTHRVKFSWNCSNGLDKRPSPFGTTQTLSNRKF